MNFNEMFFRTMKVVKENGHTCYLHSGTGWLSKASWYLLGRSSLSEATVIKKL